MQHIANTRSTSCATCTRPNAFSKMQPELCRPNEIMKNAILFKKMRSKWKTFTNKVETGCVPTHNTSPLGQVLLLCCRQTQIKTHKFLAKNATKMTTPWANRANFLFAHHKTLLQPFLPLSTKPMLAWHSQAIAMSVVASRRNGLSCRHGTNKDC